MELRRLLCCGGRRRLLRGRGISGGGGPVFRFYTAVGVLSELGDFVVEVLAALFQASSVILEVELAISRSELS